MEMQCVGEKARRWVLLKVVAAVQVCDAYAVEVSNGAG